MVEGLKKYIVKIPKKIGSTNALCYCKACFIKLGENHPELVEIVDKTQRILNHFKKCPNFQDSYSQEEKDKIFDITNSNVAIKRSKHFHLGIIA